MLNNLIRENPKALVFSSFHLVQTFAIYLVLPFLSLILLENNWNANEITIFFALFTLAGLFVSPIVGTISDYVGRKKVIMFGLIFEMILFTTYFFVIDNKPLVYILRFINGATFVCISAVIIGAFEDMIKEKRGFWTGLFLSVGTIGSIIAPVIAGYIADMYINKILYLISVFFLIISFFFIIYIPETKKKIRKLELSKLNPFSEVKEFFKYKRLRVMAVLGFLMNAKHSIYLIFFPIYVVNTLGFSETTLGLLIAIPAFIHSFQFLFGKISDAISAEFGVLIGVFLSANAFIFLPFVDTLIGLCFILFIFGIGTSIWNVNAWSLMSRIAEKRDIEGEVIGTYFSISKLGVFLITLLSAYLTLNLGIAGTLQSIAIVIIVFNIGAYFFFKPIFNHTKNKSIFHKFETIKK